MRNSRPKNLDLFTIRFPLPAIVSILHRMSGVALFLFIPIMLWGLSLSLTVEGYELLAQWAGNSIVKIIFWMFFIPYIFHLVAGIRHLFMDMHMASSLAMGRLTAKLVFVISALLILAAGVWIW